MLDYAMIFETVTSDALGGIWQNEDILGLSSTSTWQLEKEAFATSTVPFSVVIALGASYYRVKKIASEDDLFELVMEIKRLIDRLKKCVDYNDYCRLVVDTRAHFDKHKVRSLMRKEEQE